MDINNSEQENAVKKKKIFKDIDIRDVIHYLVTKSWVIVIVVAICLVGAILYTAFITPTYQSSSSMLIITDENGSTIQDFSAGQQIINNTPAVIKENVFCERVANLLNNNAKDNGNGRLDSFQELLESNPALRNELGGDVAYDFDIKKYTNGKDVTTSTIRSALDVKVSKDAQNTFTVTATTTNPKFSAIVANAVTAVYQEYITEVVVETQISTTIYQTASVAQKASNKSYPKNVAISVAVGFVSTCAILFLIFFFDDKIKTPDDIAKHLELNILGTIPDFEER